MHYDHRPEQSKNISVTRDNRFEKSGKRAVGNSAGRHTTRSIQRERIPVLQPGIERELRKQNREYTTFLEERKKQVVPVLSEFRVWLNKRANEMLPSGFLGKAVSIKKYKILA